MGEKVGRILSGLLPQVELFYKIRSQPHLWIDNPFHGPVYVSHRETAQKPYCSCFCIDLMDWKPPCTYWRLQMIKFECSSFCICIWMLIKFESSSFYISFWKSRWRPDFYFSSKMQVLNAQETQKQLKRRKISEKYCSYISWIMTMKGLLNPPKNEVKLENQKQKRKKQRIKKRDRRPLRSERLTNLTRGTTFD